MTEREMAIARKLIKDIEGGRKFIPLTDPLTRGVVLRALQREHSKRSADGRIEYLLCMTASLDQPALMYDSERYLVRMALQELMEEVDHETY